MLNGSLDGNNIFSIVCDDETGIYKAVELLYSRGHREMVYLYDVDSFSGMAKIRGFERGMKDMGLTLNSGSIIKVSPGIMGGYEGVEILDRKGIRYTAVLTSEDIIAAGVLNKLKETGKEVPGMWRLLDTITHRFPVYCSSCPRWITRWRRWR